MYYMKSFKVLTYVKILGGEIWNLFFAIHSKTLNVLLNRAFCVIYNM